MVRTVESPHMNVQKFNRIVNFFVLDSPMAREAIFQFKTVRHSKAWNSFIRTGAAQ